LNDRPDRRLLADGAQASRTPHRPDAMNPTHEVEVDGATLAVEYVQGEWPSADPVVFLHAGVADSRMWNAQQAAVGPARATLRYDRRGFGLTRVQRPARHSHLADLCAVLDAVGVQGADFVGSSQGGRIALDFALAAPHRVTSLLLVAPAVSGAPISAVEGHTARLTAAIEAAEARNDIDQVNELEAQLWLDGPDGPAGRVGGAGRALFLDMNGKALRSPAAGDATEPPSAWDKLDRVRCPAWVMWGDRDLPHVKARSEDLVERIDTARRVLLPGTAHLPMIEAPERFNAQLKTFLSI
jgi:pimeloyl-ACP methyl ester carboxylesterase